MESHILSIVLFTPLLGAILLLFVPKENKDAIRWIANIFALGGFLISLPLVPMFWVQRFEPGFKFMEGSANNWIPSIGAGYVLGIDGISFLLIMLTTLLGWISIMSSWTAIENRVKEYYVWFLFLQTGMLGVFMALDFFLFFVFWEAMLVPMYLLIGIWRGPRKLYAAIKFFLYTLAGSVLMLLGILFLYFHHQHVTGTYPFGMEALYQTAPKIYTYYGPYAATLLFLSFFFAFAIKVPMFPFHTWLPDAHVEAPTAGSVILAGVLLKLGGYGLIRYNLSLYPDASHTYAPLITVLSLIAIIYGAIVAMVQPDLKKLVAYSSVSHMGFVTLGIFVFQEQALDGAILQMINHGLITGALFLLVGVIYERTHDRTIARMGGLAALTPVYAAVFGFFVFASAGLPALSGFVGEFLTLVGTFTVMPWVAAVSALVMVLGAVYLLWMFQRVVLTEPSAFLLGLRHHLSDMTPTEILTLAPLGALVVVFGLFPGILLKIIGGSGHHAPGPADSGPAHPGEPGGGPGRLR